MEEHLCANCGASLPLTGTFCLACDTPVSEERSALSVAETFVAERGRPLKALAWAVGTLAVLGGIGYLIVSMSTGHSNNQAASAAIKGVQVIVKAEGGHAVCDYVGTTLSGTKATNAAACRALVDTDPGAVLKRLHATGTQRHGSTGTVDLKGTWVDSHGRTPFEHTVDVVNGPTGWLLHWDGKPITAS